MAKVALIRPATVPETFRINGLNTLVFPADNTNTDIPAGAFVKVNAGALAEASRDANDIVNDSSIFGLANEKFQTTLKPAGSIPIRQTGISVTLALPGLVFELNYYGDGGANSSPGIGTIGSSVAIKRLSSGIYVAVAYTTGAAKFVVTGLVDSPGTQFGRILVVPDSAYRLFK